MPFPSNGADLLVAPRGSAYAPAPAFPDTPALEPDAPAGAPVRSIAPDPSGFASALGRALDGASAAFDDAARAERAFVAGRGGLQEMTLARVQADLTLSLAAAAASRTVQALTTILGMQI